MQTKMHFSERITLSKKVHISALLSASFLFVFAALAMFPVASSFSETQATSLLGETSISMTTPDIDLPFSVDNPDGTFSASAPASFSVTTDSYSGYNLSIRAAEDDADYSKLVNGEAVLNSISSAGSSSTFNNGNWGYLPSMLEGDTNTVYQPAPTYEGTTIDTTDQANNEANTYSIAIGAKLDYSLPTGKYSNTFVITAVANPVGYTITYNPNTEDTVTDMPTTQTGDVAGQTIQLSNTIPNRSGYTFIGWCDSTTTTTSGVDSCSGTTYDAGDNVGYPAVVSLALRAMWQEYTSSTHTATVRYISDELTFTGGATANTVKYESTVTGQRSEWYMHSRNVNDAGVQNGTYGHERNINKSVTIPGAEYLTVDVTYQIQDPYDSNDEDSYYDWICLWSGNHPDYDMETSCSSSISGGKLAGETLTTSSYTVNDNSVTLVFVSDWDEDNFYGYYVVVKGYDSNGDLIYGEDLYSEYIKTSGNYAVPNDANGRHFAGWSTTPNATTPDYLIETDVYNEALRQNEVTNLYAVVWDNYQTIHFDANGGTGTKESESAQYGGGTINMQNNEFTKSGNYFIGWNTKADGSGTGYPTTTYTVPAYQLGVPHEITVYAQWTSTAPICTENCDTDHPTYESGITIQRAYELALTQAHRGMYEEDTPGSGTYHYVDSWNGESYQGEGREVRFAMQDMWRTYSYQQGNVTKTVNVCDLVTVIGDEYQALDTRDNKLYWIAKLADGKCWMTQNLDLDLIHVADGETPLYNHWNTDLGWYTEEKAYSSLDDIPSYYPSNYTYRKVSSNYYYVYYVTFPNEEDATWNPAKSTTNVANLTNDDSMSAPRSTDVGDWYYTDTFTMLTDSSVRNNYNYLSTGNNAFFSNTPYANNGMHGHVGNYYNWNAAVAMNDTSSIDLVIGGGGASEDTQRSICPAGWRLLTGSLNIGQKGNIDNPQTYISAWGTGSNDDYSWDDTGGIKIFYNNGHSDTSAGFEAAPVYWTRAGTIRQGTMSNAGFDGYYWSSEAGYWDSAYFGSTTKHSNEQAWETMVRSSLVDASDRYYRDRQRSVRCIAR